MSVELDVKLTKPIKISELLSLTTSALKELLSVAEVPTLTAIRRNRGISTPVTEGQIGQGESSFLIGFYDMEEAVGLVVFEIKRQEPNMSDEETGFWTSISVGMVRSPLEYALAASIAIVIARYSKTVISDDNTLWTNLVEQSPDRFADAVKVQRVFKDVQLAAEAMFKNLPVSKDRNAY